MISKELFEYAVGCKDLKFKMNASTFRMEATLPDGRIVSKDDMQDGIVLYGKGIQNEN